MIILSIYRVPQICNTNIYDCAKYLNWRRQVIKLRAPSRKIQSGEDVMDMIWRCDGYDMKMWWMWYEDVFDMKKDQTLHYPFSMAADFEMSSMVSQLLYKPDQQNQRGIL